MKAESRTMRALKLHREIMEQLEKSGMLTSVASREALRRLQDKKMKFDDWRDYFTAVELEGIDLPHA